MTEDRTRLPEGWNTHHDTNHADCWFDVRPKPWRLTVPQTSEVAAIAAAWAIADKEHADV